MRRGRVSTGGCSACLKLKTPRRESCEGFCFFARLRSSFQSVSPLFKVALAIAVFSLVVFLPRKLVGGRRLFLLRVLFPSWRFFESIGVVPSLYVRACDREGLSGEWHLALRPQPRGLSRVIFNPWGNLHFARQSAVEHLVSEAEGELGGQGGPQVQIDQTAAYRVVRAISREAVFGGLGAVAQAQSVGQFQFKISCRDENGLEQDFLLSPVIPLGSVEEPGGPA